MRRSRGRRARSCSGARCVTTWASLRRRRRAILSSLGLGRGHVRSYAHDDEGAAITRLWLRSLRLGEQRIAAVACLVRYHLAPALYVKNGAKARGYRRLARKLDEGGVTPLDLERVARADHLGRTTSDARAFVERGPRKDVVRAATLMKQGIEAGPELGRLLARAREIQDETGIEEEHVLVARLLAEGPNARG